MLDFLKKDKEELKQEVEEEKEKIEKCKDNNCYSRYEFQLEMKRLLESLNSENSESLAVLKLINQNLNRLANAEEYKSKQLVLGNALKFLEYQFNTTDRIMSLNEIKDYSKAIAEELFSDYRRDELEVKENKENE